MQKIAVFSSALLLLLPSVSFASINSLNSLTVATQTITTTSDSHLLVSSLTSTHTIKWDVTAWNMNQGGTGTTTFATGSIPFVKNGAFTSNITQLFWDTVNNLLNIGGTVSPNAKLTVKGSGGFGLLNVASSSGSSILYVTSGGNVGISSTAPTAKLTVNGASGDTNTYLFAITNTVGTSTSNLFLVDKTGSTTISNGVNITDGCFAVRGQCLSLGGSGSVNPGTAGQVAYYQTDGSTVSGTSTIFMSPNGFVGINNVSPLAPFDIAGAYYSRLVSISNGGMGTTTVNIDWNAGNVQTYTLTGNTTFTFTNGQSGGDYKLILSQDSTGGSLAIFPGSVKWPGGVSPMFTTTENATDVLEFVYNGSNYFGSAQLNY